MSFHCSKRNKIKEISSTAHEEMNRCVQIVSNIGKSHLILADEKLILKAIQELYYITHLRRSYFS